MAASKSGDYQLNTFWSGWNDRESICPSLSVQEIDLGFQTGWRANFLRRRTRLICRCLAHGLGTSLLENLFGAKSAFGRGVFFCGVRFGERSGVFGDDPGDFAYSVFGPGFRIRPQQGTWRMRQHDKGNLRQAERAAFALGERREIIRR